MAQEQAKQLLQRGIAAAQGGRPDVARDLLQQAIRLDPQSELAWLWLSSVARNDQERLFCLKQLLAINPQNEFALKGLQALGVQPPAQAAEPVPATSVPVVDEQKMARIQQEVEIFLRRYNPHPLEQPDIRWTRKQKRRYGEGTAQRLQRATYAAATAVLILVVAAVVFVTVQIVGGGGTKVASRATPVLTSTPTPTMTPTVGGPPPTAFPEPMAVPPTTIPEGLPPGSIYGNPPTAIYPRLDPNIANSIKGAIELYSFGAADLAVQTLAAERERSRPDCYPSVGYYEAMGYVAQGGMTNLNRAAQLLQQELDYQPANVRMSTCQGSPLILAGLGYVRYLQGKLDEALALSSQALNEDPKLIQAVITIGTIQLERGQYAEAWQTVTGALNESPADTNLLLLAARIELASDHPDSALQYIGQALFVDPLLHPALRMQAEAYLRLGERETDPEKRLQYYGLGVIGAQTLLLYYPGDPAGYLYLGRARIGEGNYEMAETALSRVIAVGPDLPDNADTATVVQAAYRARAELYSRQGYLVEARSDLEEVVRRSPTDVDSLKQLLELTLRTGDYPASQGYLDDLLALAPDDPALLLPQARLLVEVCTFLPRDLTCAYQDMLNQLADDTRLAGLAPVQLAEAYSYRAQARYWVTRQNPALQDEERQLAYQLALSDVNAALDTRDRALDHYYRGLIYQELGLLPQAFEDYEWVAYWNKTYAYPFIDEDFEERVAAVSAVLQASTEPVTASAEPGVEPTEVPAATPTPAPTATPIPTATPEPEPTTPELP